MTDRHEFQIQQKDNRKRLDDFLFDAFPYLSRMYLREVVRDGKCEVNGELVNRGYELRPKDFIEVEIDLERHTTLKPEDIPIEVLFEDDQILVCVKPSGMLVHPTVGVRNGTLLNALAHHLNKEGETESFNRAGLVHRLDKDTSGLMVVAKTHRAHRILSSHFQKKIVEKKYFARVEGLLENREGTIVAPIGRFEEERLWGIHPEGKESVTNYSVVSESEGRTLLALEPVTGRTNQLRIHLAHIGHPILGDIKYGGVKFARLCLHSCLLKFKHPADGRVLEFGTEVPADFY